LAEYPALDVEILDERDADGLRDRLSVLLDDFEPVAIQENEAGTHWRVFFGAPAARDRAAAHVRSSLAADRVRTAPVEVEDEDWARRSQEDLRAIEVGRLVVAPPWDVPRGTRDAAGALADFPVIVIEPSMGFGTGHHATTRLCLHLLQQLELRGARAIDVGTGSGVLALAAWKLGASEVTAVDHDPDALDNARENIARNGAGGAIDIILDDLRSLRVERADVVTANLTGAVLVRFAAELRALVAEGGYLILSGFAPADLPIVERAFDGMTPIAEQAEDDWAAAALRAE
jgi:ribosomal protein L11 methyltransferase